MSEESEKEKIAKINFVNKILKRANLIDIENYEDLQKILNTDNTTAKLYKAMIDYLYELKNEYEIMPEEEQTDLDLEASDVLMFFIAGLYESWFVFPWDFCYKLRKWKAI